MKVLLTRSVCFLLLLPVVLLGCDDERTGPSVEEVLE